MSDSDAEFERVATRAVKAATAIEQWEKAHGRVFDKPLRISCPNCLEEDALKFARSQYHLYFECTTADCLPLVRGKYNRRR